MNDMSATNSDIRVRTQAQVVIEKFGDAYKLAALLGCDPATVYRWTYARANGGTDGIIPGRALRKVLAAAKSIGVVITPQDLYPLA